MWWNEKQEEIFEKGMDIIIQSMYAVCIIIIITSIILLVLSFK